VALRDELERLEVAELLTGRPCLPAPVAPPRGGAHRAAGPQLFDAGRAAERLAIATGTIKPPRISASTRCRLGVRAAGAVLGYCERSRVALEPGLLRLVPRQGGELMRLDPPTRRNLELLEPLGRGPSLAQLLDRTRTPMGARLLRRRLQEPLIEPAPIGARLAAVAALVTDRARREELRRRIGAVRDLERLVGRAVQGLATPRDLGAIRDACAALPAVAALMEDLPGDLAGLAEKAVPPPEVGDRLTALLVEDPPPTAREGGFVRDGADPSWTGCTPRRRRHAGSSPGWREASGSAPASAPSRSGTTASSATTSRSPTPTATRCPPTTSASRRWWGPSATSPPSQGAGDGRAQCPGARPGPRDGAARRGHPAGHRPRPGPARLRRRRAPPPTSPSRSPPWPTRRAGRAPRSTAPRSPTSRPAVTRWSRGASAAAPSSPTTPAWTSPTGSSSSPGPTWPASPPTSARWR
jgi:hypothetical protein